MLASDHRAAAAGDPRLGRLTRNALADQWSADEAIDWTRKINGGLLNLERAVFLAGFYKAFVLFVDPCNFCEECVPIKNDCEHPKNARPSPEGLGVDVFATARKAGKPIVVLDDYDREMNRYAILLVD